MKVGDYVRTKNGINKIIYIDDIFGSDGKHSFYTIRLENDNLIFEDEVIISSPNIIDLIEVGDYVNGNEVLEIKNFGSFNGIRVFGEIYYNEEIKSIVTKEMYERMEYKIGEEDENN